MEPYVSNVISQKYDTALDFHVTMYDNMPYKRDPDYCNAEKIALVSGSVLKFYLYIHSEETFEIDNRDNDIEQIIAKCNAPDTERRRPRASELAAQKERDGVTQEQIHQVIDDKSSDAYDDFAAQPAGEDEVDAAEDAVNAFEDVEDW